MQDMGRVCLAWFRIIHKLCSHLLYYTLLRSAPIKPQVGPPRTWQIHKNTQIHQCTLSIFYIYAETGPKVATSKPQIWWTRRTDFRNKYFWEYISGIHLNTCPIYQKKWALKSKNLHCDIEICPEFSIRVCVKFAVWHLGRRCGYYTSLSWSAGGGANIEN